ncbi:hypothetical protein [Sporosarcina cyprini]|uniref:hypothetical protein n=1 Tax=Sporosarcina cyprini TaxID=2910523 RepID=UPI001EDD1C60|nr:hypothetical protein [Sporosarcina cyprini]MCG3089145.1 hypothetical protein [Sporosarcina cyprini]
MIVETRKTAGGTEYWDTKKMRTLFVPTGVEPDFNVTENPQSMIIGVDLAGDKDYTVVNDQVIETETELDKMNSDQLLAFAEHSGIDVPGNMKKAETIRKYIVEKMATDAE